MKCVISKNVTAWLVLLLLTGVAASEAKTNSVGHGSSQSEQSVAPAAALQLLKEGNARYAKEIAVKHPTGASTWSRLSKGQHPHTIVLSCADSRVPPEYVFDQGIGDLFVIRVAGEALDSSVIASIEYAVEHLGTRLVVVMGHNQCGAVKATLETPPNTSAGSKSLDALVADIRPRLKASGRSADLSKESGANADIIAGDLLERSPLIRQKAEDGTVEIRSALYHLESGVVDFRTNAHAPTAAKQH